MPTEYFEQRERALLGPRYEQLYAAPQQTAERGVTVSALRTTPEQFAQRADFPLEPSPFCKAAFVVHQPDFKPGRHPYHHAGVFYSQEPSASSAAPLLGVQPGMRVLDLCAAPGGKSSQLAAALQGRGVLVSNEYVAARAEILKSNLERMGVSNAVVLNETPARIAEALPEFFDRVLVDAPCSGEGMFRKEPVALQQHCEALVKQCAELGAQILDCAAAALAPGGQLVYSTCTFAPEEDEGSVHRFLERHPDCQIAEGIDSEGFIHDKEGCIRLFPHKIEGEGHFAAVITKAGEGYGGFGLTEKGIKEKDCPEYLSFVKENLKEKPQGALLKFGEQLYLMPEGFPALKGLKVLRPGLHLGTLKKNRFEPSHALALAMQPQEAFHVAMLSSGSQEIRQYLMGQTFSWGGEKGWYLICVDGYSIGWGKLAGGIMKNHYPKGLRMMDII